MLSLLTIKTINSVLCDNYLDRESIKKSQVKVWEGAGSFGGLGFDKFPPHSVRSAIGLGSWSPIEYVFCNNKGSSGEGSIDGFGFEKTLGSVAQKCTSGDRFQVAM